MNVPSAFWWVEAMSVCAAARNLLRTSLILSIFFVSMNVALYRAEPTSQSMYSRMLTVSPGFWGCGTRMAFWVLTSVWYCQEFSFTPSILRCGMDIG